MGGFVGGRICRLTHEEFWAWTDNHGAREWLLIFQEIVTVSSNIAHNELRTFILQGSTKLGISPFQ